MSKKQQKQQKQQAKQEAKQLKIQQKEQRQQEKYSAAAADGKISRDELKDLYGKQGFKFGGKVFGGMSREQMATDLAKFAMANPNVQIGGGVSKQIGLKIKTDEGGNRYGVYKPEKVGGGRGGNGSPTARVDATPDFGKANTSWLATGGGLHRYGGAPGYTVQPYSGGDGGYGTGGAGSGAYDPERLGDGSTPGSGSDPISGLPSEPDKPTFQSAMNADLSGNASGFRSRKSSWRDGRSSKGTSNLKINPITNAFGVGLNYRGAF